MPSKTDKISGEGDAFSPRVSRDVLCVDGPRRGEYYRVEVGQEYLNLAEMPEFKITLKQTDVGPTPIPILRYKICWRSRHAHYIGTP